MSTRRTGHTIAVERRQSEDPAAVAAQGGDDPHGEDEERDRERVGQDRLAVAGCVAHPGQPDEHGPSGEDEGGRGSAHERPSVLT